MPQLDPSNPEAFSPRSLWDFDDPAGSLARFEAAADDAQHPVVRAILTTQMARAAGLMGDFERGRELIRGAGMAAEASAVAGSVVSAWAAIESGRLIRSSGGPIEEARAEFEAAARFAEAAGLEALHIDALHMVALTLEPQQQVVVTLTALEKAKASTDSAARGWIASLLNNLGMAYSDLGQWDAALGVFEEALAERMAQGGEGAIFVARYMIGWALRNLGRRQEALDWLLQLQSDLTLAGRTDQYVAAELKLLAEN